jgi:HJR/Mrr/RecB family endonuclease
MDIDSKGTLRTFDERLHSLLNQKISDASDFLIPLPSEDSLGADLFNDLRGSESKDGRMPPIRESSAVSVLTPHMFEALVAEMFRREGKRVVLTPQAGDGGVDVIAVDRNSVALIECKHSGNRGALSEESLHHFINGIEYYRNNILSRECLMKSRETILVTNAIVERAFRKQARQNEIQIITESDLLERLRQQYNAIRC